ncbi:NAD-dependent epimerase/dehydratase family protein [Jiulongibacter sp. NS-SX5]|uniref:NAD-dependent epimerase/dehydratase family protein n=1 Tax=Jiulongibacter sp. NS-SX5 TaxID=3463854 RepID=UPI004059956E
MKVIITGATGMVGRGVLLEAIEDPNITDILLVNRNPIEVSDPKIKEVILKDFTQFQTISSELKGYDACYHCMGVSSAGMSEEKYTELTFEVTKSLVDELYKHQPNMVVCYVSGQGTDSSEKGRSMWARVKGKTENMILQKGFKDAYAFRPGAIIPEKGIKSRTALYQVMLIIMGPFYGLLKKMRSVTTTTRIGRAMINVVNHPQENKHPGGAEINQMASLA